MFEGNTKTPVSWNDYKLANFGTCNRLVVESSAEGFSLRLLHQEVVGEWLLCRQEYAVPATAVDEAACFHTKAQGIVSTDALVMLQPVGMVDSVLLGYSFSETHGLNGSSNAEPTCRRFVFDTQNWEYLELFWFSNATVTASWIKFFPDGKRIRYFVLYEAPPEGKLPYKLLRSFELIGYRTTLPEVTQKPCDHFQDSKSIAGQGDGLESCTESPLGIQDNLPNLFYDKSWNKNKEATRKSFQLLQQLYIGEYRGTQRFTQYQVCTGNILEEHVNSFYTIIVPLKRSMVELEKVQEMKKLCFLPRAKSSELSPKLRELMVEAGILLEYYGPDHAVNEEAKQKRKERRLAKRKRGKPNENRKYIGIISEDMSKKDKKETCKSLNDKALREKESHQSHSTPDWKQRITSYVSRPCSPGLSQSSFSTQPEHRKRSRVNNTCVENTHSYKEQGNIERVDSPVTTMDYYVGSMSNNNTCWRNDKTLYVDSFDPSQVTEEEAYEHHRVNLMLGPYGSTLSSSIQGDMIGFSDEKERIWMFSTTEPECRRDEMESTIPGRKRKQETTSRKRDQPEKQQQEEDWTIANDELYRLGEEWPSPFLQSTQLDESLGSSSPCLDIPLWNNLRREWPEDILYTSSESSSDWFIKTLALEDSHGGMKSWSELDSGVAQVEEIEKSQSHWMFSEESVLWNLP